MRQSVSTIAVLAGFFVCAAPAAQAGDERLVFFGTHGVSASRVAPDRPVPPHGIYAARLDENTGRLTSLRLAIELERPTWLVASQNQNILYAVNEIGNDGKSHGAVLSLALDGDVGRLRLLNQVDSGGGGPTNLALDPAAPAVFVANYGSGTVGSFAIGSDGALGSAISVVQDHGTGPTPRQKGPHAHGVTVDPSGRYLLVPDLGADKVFIYRIDAATRQLSPSEPAYESLPPGSGPRHLVFHPNGKFAYLILEMAAEVRTYRWDGTAGRLQPLQTQSILPPGYSGKKAGGDIEVSGDGRFVYLTSRGENSIVVYAIDQQSGRLAEIQRVSAQGDSPWHIAFDPDRKWLLVADEASSRVFVYRIDQASGKLTPTSNSVTVPRPVNIVFPTAK